jgi:Regulator of ribonuclease activity B
MQPDLHRDAAALFQHMRDAGMELEELNRWSFMFESDEIEPLEELGEFLDARLREFFHVLLQESKEEFREDGGEVQGPPLLRLEFVGVVDEPMLAGMHERLDALAAEYGVRYVGVSNYSEFPFDLDMFDAAIAKEGFAYLD